MKRLVFLAFFTLASPARSETDRARYSIAYHSCVDRAQGSYTRITACLGAEQDIQERLLNRTYLATMRRLSPLHKALLRQEERAWISAREEQCALPEGSKGTSNLVDSLDCRLEETIRRTILLERY